MPTISNFDIRNNLKVEFYIAGANTNNFIIGVSKLGGPDVLAYDGFVIGVSLLGGDDVLTENAFGFEWTDLSCITNKAELTIGGSVEDDLYFQPEPGIANLTLQSLERDPVYSPAFRAGIQVRVRLVKDAIDQVIWSGVVDSIQTSYDPDGNNLMQVLAYDNFKRLMNTRFDVFDSEFEYPIGYLSPYEQLEMVADLFGTSMNAASSDPGGKIPTTIQANVIPNGLVYEAIQVGLGIFWLDPSTQEFVFIPRPSTVTAPLGTPVIGNQHGLANHLCMSNIITGSTEDVVYNSLKVSLNSDDTISTLRENQDSIDLYGKYAQDVILNTTDLAELNRWADIVFQQYPTNLVQQVETPARDRLGNLTEAAFFTPGTVVGVKYNEGVIDIDEYFTAVKVSHYIDTDNWFTTLDLWNEA
jgi:hypothetical protein